MFTNRMLIWPASSQPTVGSGRKASDWLPTRSVGVAHSTKCCMWCLANCDDWKGLVPQSFTSVGIVCADLRGFLEVWILTRVWCLLLVLSVSQVSALPENQTSKWPWWSSCHRFRPMCRSIIINVIIFNNKYLFLWELWPESVALTSLNLPLLTTSRWLTHTSKKLI